MLAIHEETGFTFDELAKMDDEESKDSEMVTEDSEKPKGESDILETPEDLDDDDLPPGVLGDQLDSAFQDSKEAQMMVQQAQKEYSENNLFKVESLLFNPYCFDLCCSKTSCHLTTSSLMTTGHEILPWAGSTARTS